MINVEYLELKMKKFYFLTLINIISVFTQIQPQEECDTMSVIEQCTDGLTSEINYYTGFCTQSDLLFCNHWGGGEQQVS